MSKSTKCLMCFSLVCLGFDCDGLVLSVIGTVNVTKLEANTLSLTMGSVRLIWKDRGWTGLFYNILWCITIKGPKRFLNYKV